MVSHAHLLEWDLKPIFVHVKITGTLIICNVAMQFSFNKLETSLAYYRLTLLNTFGTETFGSHILKVNNRNRAIRNNEYMRIIELKYIDICNIYSLWILDLNIIWY